MDAVGVTLFGIEIEQGEKKNEFVNHAKAVFSESLRPSVIIIFTLCSASNEQKRF